MANASLGKLFVKMREEYSAKVKEAFAVFDKENTGFIKREDVGKALRSIGDEHTDDQLKPMIDVLDVDKNGVVEFSSFLNLLLPPPKDGEPERYLKSAFKMFDKDGDGFISAADLGDALASPGAAIREELADFFIKAADSDGDGKMSYEEFKEIMVLLYA